MVMGRQGNKLEAVALGSNSRQQSNGEEAPCGLTNEFHGAVILLLLAFSSYLNAVGI